MRRQPKPWYRASKNAWFIDREGVKVRIGLHPDDLRPPKKTRKGWDVPPLIMEAFYREMSTRPESIPSWEKLPLATIADLFLDYAKRHLAKESYTLARYYLESFCNANQCALAKDIKPIHVTRWLDDHSTWKGSRHHAVRAIKRVYSYAEEQGVLEINPLRKLKVPPTNIRTRVLSKKEIDEILKAIRDTAFRNFVEALLETGCRPSEVRTVEASMVDLEQGIWEFKTHKTVKKTQKSRFVYLTPKMVELSRKLMEKFPEGPLFRGPRKDLPFSRNAVRQRFLRLREKLPHLKHFTCYNLRHTFATQALVNGVGVAQVAQLLGHTSTIMVSRIYGHLTDQIVHMREAAKRAVG